MSDSHKIQLTLPSLPHDPPGAQRLRQALRDALRDVTFVGALGLATLSCGGGFEPLTTQGFEPRSCTPKGNWDAFSGVTFAAPQPDYAALQMNVGASGPLTATMGKKCATAKNLTACEAAVEAAITDNSGCNPGGCDPKIVTTLGDQVVALSRSNVAAVLAPIDSPNEAALIAALSRLSIQCGTAEKGGVRTVDGGAFEVRATSSRSDCETDDVIIRVEPTGSWKTVAVAGPPPNNGCAVGRMPDGLCTAEADPHETRWSLASHLTEAAQLEAASVPAFLVLARDLEACAAPESLVARAVASARDEVRHASIISKLAVARGGRACGPVTMAPTASKSLFALALDNATEGCVRETFGALVASYQATQASDKAVASAMAEIATDEAEHAALAHDIAQWLWPQLTETERAAVIRAHRQAVTDLHEALGREHDSDLYTGAGWPRPAIALALHERLAQQLWS